MHPRAKEYADELNLDLLKYAVKYGYVPKFMYTEQEASNMLESREQVKSFWQEIQQLKIVEEMHAYPGYPEPKLNDC